ncbi:CG0192 family protein [Corynebacterium vitaeruminis]|uniref:Maltokinase N-terminal cap domain-containing protein n=1 Tax=Corynebacterium vitaeruminis DSM 20294 TaxID=1224164 RepID=W5XXW7_9CORY|nr:hypothetical protein [Corynebacterium vitaeruminis]AHI21529.1 hypothetical protein B843_00665 [Corynebacterium vitaeruminis DSM 20294]
MARKEAKIEQATLTPTKQEVANKWLGGFRHIGSYRLVDPEGEVGIEALIGFDADDRLIQIPFSYRSKELDPHHTLGTIEHSVLGTRYVSNALGDPVAVAEFIRTIVDGGQGATFSNGTQPALEIQGSGQREGDPALEIGEVTLREVTRQRAVGWAKVNGKNRGFILRMPQILVPEWHLSRGHSVSPLRITGHTPDDPAHPLVVAELGWTDLPR